RRTGRRARRDRGPSATQWPYVPQVARRVPERWSSASWWAGARRAVKRRALRTTLVDDFSARNRVDGRDGGNPVDRQGQHVIAEDDEVGKRTGRQDALLRVLKFSGCGAACICGHRIRDRDGARGRGQSEHRVQGRGRPVRAERDGHSPIDETL